MKDVAENLAALPLKQAMRAAKADERSILQNPKTFDRIWHDIVLNWIDERVRSPEGMSAEESDKFTGALVDAFEMGLRDAVKALSKGRIS
jgi:hypothetical protein